MELGTTITLYDGFEFQGLQKGDEIRLLAFGSTIDELWRITEFDGYTITVTLIRTSHILEEQFNNVLFKMFER